MTTDIFTYIDSSQSESGSGGPLEGKTIAIQPNMSVRGWPTEAGSSALERFVALEDATVVERLKEAGATIRGSTCMSELGFGLVGDSAARAVAEGEVDIALVTDTMGEARVSASATGLFGFKPSYGIVSRFGLIGLVPSMECFGIMAKTPAEIIAVLEAITGADDRDFSMSEDAVLDFGDFDRDQPITGTLGVIRENSEFLDRNESKAFDVAISRLEEVGINIREVSLEECGLFRTVHNVIGSVEASSSAGKYDGVRYGHRTQSSRNWNEMYLKSRAESFGLPVKAYLFQGAYFQFENYKAFENACRLRSGLVKQTEALYDEVDFLAVPTRNNGLSIDETRTIDEIYDLFTFTLPANVTGQPAIHVPGSLFGREKDPGLQFIAPRLGDVRLLSLAAKLRNFAKGDK